ncbi:Macrophage mannose receptor 1 [Amphibalanus amphitrite]|uniref:Macrophage mannose receptor 1 n=1 Tax=Amphibalanus amphitrite TaxID=1232801 RepID=A0A6A4WTQ6_AMPAM|nr:Macrophage mannose receptor 1 [Amphibalanus amphitrite]
MTAYANTKSLSLNYICAPDLTDPCPEGYHPLDDQCIKVSDTTATYHEAQAVCHEDNADLLYIKYFNERFTVPLLVKALNSAQLTRQFVWIGYDRIDDPTFTNIWGEPGSFNQGWLKNGPGTTPQDCVILQEDTSWLGGYVFNVRDCNERHHYACTYRGQQRKNICPEEFPFYYQGDCFRVSNSSLTFAQAEVECSLSTGGYSKLAAPQASHVSMFGYLAARFDDLWVGLDDRAGGLTNSGGSPVLPATVARLPTPAASSRRRRSTGQCMAIRYGGYQLTDCQQRRRHVCLLVRSPSCPDRFIRHQDNCYLVGTRQRLNHTSYWVGLSSDEKDETSLFYPNWEPFTSGELQPVRRAAVDGSASLHRRSLATTGSPPGESHRASRGRTVICHYQGLPTCPAGYTALLDSGYTCLRHSPENGTFWSKFGECYNDGPNTGLAVVSSGRVQAAMMPEHQNRPVGNVVQRVRWIDYNAMTWTDEVTELHNNGTNMTEIWRDKCATLDLESNWLRNDCLDNFAALCEHTVSACYSTRGHQCIFPFLGPEDGVEYHNCTSLDTTNIFQPYCATAVQCSRELPNVPADTSPGNASVLVWDGLYEYLTPIEFTCPTGHVFEGLVRKAHEGNWSINPSPWSQLTSVECDATGQWMPAFLPNCVPFDCLGPPLEPPEWVSYDWDNATISYGHTVRYWCTPGVGWAFPSDGAIEHFSTCQENGNWSLTELEDCILMPCPDPAPETVTNQTFSYGLVFSNYTCPPAWEFADGSRQKSAECLLETKVWEPAVMPPCQDADCRFCPLSERRCAEEPPEVFQKGMTRKWPKGEDGQPNYELDVVIQYRCPHRRLTWEFNETIQEVMCIHDPESDLMVWEPFNITLCNPAAQLLLLLLVLLLLLDSPPYGPSERLEAGASLNSASNWRSPLVLGGWRRPGPARMLRPSPLVFLWGSQSPSIGSRDAQRKARRQWGKLQKLLGSFSGQFDSDEEAVETIYQVVGSPSADYGKGKDPSSPAASGAALAPEDIAGVAVSIVPPSAAAPHRRSVDVTALLGIPVTDGTPGAEADPSTGHGVPSMIDEEWRRAAATEQLVGVLSATSRLVYLGSARSQPVDVPQINVVSTTEEQAQRLSSGSALLAAAGPGEERTRTDDVGGERGDVTSQPDTWRSPSGGAVET